jgi:hypothetical protein
MSDTVNRELDWYLRDHLFRQSNAGKTTFRRESLPNEMATLYLRYRSADPQQLSKLMIPVIDNLIARKVLAQEGNELKMPGRLVRLQCAKCFYINYLSQVEQKICLRCQQSELHDFPRKKA